MCPLLICSSSPAARKSEPSGHMSQIRKIPSDDVLQSPELGPLNQANGLKLVTDISVFFPICHFH